MYYLVFLLSFFSQINFTIALLNQDLSYFENTIESDHLLRINVVSSMHTAGMLHVNKIKIEDLWCA